jgi:hypothetical protein
MKNMLFGLLREQAPITLLRRKPSFGRFEQENRWKELIL